MATLLIYPGQLGEVVPLQSVLREAHDALRADRAREIEARTKNGIPLDDSTRWERVSASVHDLQARMIARDTAGVVDAARAIVDATSGNVLEPIAPYETSSDLDGISVQMRVVSDAERRHLKAGLVAAWQAMRDAGESRDAVAIAAARERLSVAQGALVVAVVARIDGIDGLRDTIANSLDGLALAGFLDPLYVAANHFVDLPVGKALRCGLQPLST